MSSKLLTTLKYNLVTVNFFFVITGIITLYLGIKIQALYDGYFIFFHPGFVLPAFYIAAGALVFAIAAAGLYGAIMENYLIKILYALAMILMLVFQLSVCITAFSIKASTLDTLQIQLSWTQNIYGPDKSLEATQQWDKLQEQFRCCGVLNASDWLEHLNTQETLGLPVSCCSPDSGEIFNCVISNAFTRGCFEIFGQFVGSELDVMGFAGVFLTLIQGLIVVNVISALLMVKIARE